MSSRSTFTLRPLAAAALAAVAAVLALAAFASAALAAPAATVTPSAGLSDGSQVVVSGSGFTPPTPTLNPGATPPQIGLYVAQAAIDGSDITIGGAQEWVRPAAFGGTGSSLLNPDGTFQTQLTLEQVIGSGPDAVDCAVATCSIITWQAHGNPVVANLFTVNTLAFGPEVHVNPDTDIAATGQTVDVDGLGIPSSYVSGKGIIVSQFAVVGGQVKTPGAGSQGVSRYIRASGTGPNKLNADGSFDSDLTLKSTFTSTSGVIDCTAVQCEVGIWEGQSFPADESALLARAEISFGPGIAVTPADDLSVLGQDVSVEGALFDPVDFPSGVKASLGLIDGSNVWLNDVVDVTPEGDGSFEADVPVAGLFIKPGQSPSSASAAVDCIVLQCSILVWDGETDAPGPDDIIASKPVSFQRPSLEATPATGLDQGQTVSVSGGGFSPAGTGAYISQVALIDGQVVTPPPVSPNIMQWVRSASLGGSGITLLNGDGTFETSIVVSRTFKAADESTIDCMVEQCEIIAWRGHTNPTPESIYASAPLSFNAPVDPNPPVDPPVDPIPPATTPPSATVRKQAQFKLGTKAKKVSFATVRCGSAVCNFQKPKRVAVTIGGSKVWLAVTGPKRAGADTVAKFGVHISAKTAKKLAGGKARVKFQIKASSDSGEQTIQVNKLLVGPSK